MAVIVDREYLSGLLQGAGKRYGEELARAARQPWYTPYSWRACLGHEVASRSDIPDARQHFFVSQAQALHNQRKREEKERRERLMKAANDTPLFNV